MAKIVRCIRLLFGVVVIVSIATTASACLNDSELPDHEREFRSQYLQKSVSATESSNRSRDRLWIWSATGLVLLGGAIAISMYRRQNPGPLWVA